jgi:outer membrane protein assembly factor BamE (lipoprotein component of BamABCDE complex)
MPQSRTLALFAAIVFVQVAGCTTKKEQLAELVQQGNYNSKKFQTAVALVSDRLEESIGRLIGGPSDE